jgi:hypothetical protein
MTNPMDLKDIMKLLEEAQRQHEEREYEVLMEAFGYVYQSGDRQVVYKGMLIVTSPNRRPRIYRADKTWADIFVEVFE